MKEIIITEGFYKEDCSGKEFEVKMYRWKNPKTKKEEWVVLAPIWIVDDPKDWEKITKQGVLL